MSEIGPGDLYFEDIDAVSLQALYTDKVAATTAVGRDGLQPRNVTSNQAISLVQSAADALRGNAYVFTPYRQMLKIKGAGKPPRQIAIPSLRDRLVLKMMAEYLRKLFPNIRHRKPQDLVEAVRRAVQSGKFSDYVRLDLVNFYPSIPHQTIEQILHSKIAPAEFVTLLMAALANPTLPDGPRAQGPNLIGVPAGLSLANALGEIVLNGIDEDMAMIDGIAYFRYVDDILVLCGHGQRTVIRMQLNTRLEALGLRAHRLGKSHKSAAGKIQKESVEYLGYTFVNGKVTVDRSRFSRLSDSLARPLTMYRHALEETSEIPRAKARAEWWLNLTITGCISEGKRRGWLPYYSQLDDMGRLQQLDAMVNRFMARIPDEHRFAAKTFQRAFTLTRHPGRDRNGYIPNFDEIDDIEKFHILNVASRYQNIPTDVLELDRLFKRFIGTAVASLETDVGVVS